ncbi:MAG: SdiA-regulated domain-containing protein, partial [Kangiellaceae bacterium]|nr:SdiA-regulated domain-containing protein [Kangiellaceae bacterium]
AFASNARDLAGMTYDERTNNLIIVSQQSKTAMQVDPDTGAIRSTLSLNGAPQYEGVTIGPNGELVFVSEGNWIHIFELN